MLKRWLGRLRRGQPPLDGVGDARCTACPLVSCARGSRAAVLRMDCAREEAGRLRNLGLHEGACIRVLESQDGLLLEVRGSRLAVGATLAASILVLPLGS